MRRKFVLLALQYAGLKLLLLRRTLPELRENHILPLQAELTGVAKYNADEKAFTFTNGSRIKLGYCDSEADAFQYQGSEFDVVGFEEATLFTDSMIQFILTANRSTRPDFKPRAYYTMNPGGPSHSYFKRLFIDRDFHLNEKPDDYIFIPAKVYDNTVLMENNPEYINVLKALPDELRKAHLDGDWNIFIGQVFREFRSDDHVVNKFDIPGDWIKFRAMDWGFSKPYCVIWGAVDFDGVIYIYRELAGIKEGTIDTGTQETANEVAKKVKKLEKGEQIAYGIADPACWAKTGHDGPSIAEVFKREGVIFKPADNDRIAGKMQLHMRLKENTIKIFDTCRYLVKTIPMLAYDKNRPEDVDTTGPDHCFIAGTMVTTDKGDKPIETIAVGDNVLTRQGYRPVDACGCTNESAETYTLYLCDGRSITGTGNHPVWIEGNGFTPIADIKQGDIVWQNQSCLMESNTTDTQNHPGCQTGITTDRQADTLSKDTLTYTKRFGSIIMALYRLITTFTTKTAIFLTTVLKPLNVFLCSIICRNTEKNTHQDVNTWIKSDRLQKSGDNRQQAESGTSSTLKTYLVIDQQCKQSANSAEKNTKSETQIEVKANFVQTTASQSGAKTAELITSNENVQYVEITSLSTNTASNIPVLTSLSTNTASNIPVLAPVLVSRVEKNEGRSKVYNMSVVSENEYFANGILVHNCYDSLRYMLMSRLFKPELVKERKKEEKYKKKQETKSWMAY